MLRNIPPTSSILFVTSNIVTSVWRQIVEDDTNTYGTDLSEYIVQRM